MTSGGVGPVRGPILPPVPSGIPAPSRPRTPPILGLAVIAVVLIAAAITIAAVFADDDGAKDPKAPWRATPVPRNAVPPAYAAAWERAGNRTKCALLYPIDGGPEMATSEATGSATPDGKGWDIFLNSAAGTVEVLGLFDKTAPHERGTGTDGSVKTWADGSEARYRPDTGNLAPGSFDPNAAPFEAVLTLPDQSCAYRIYDTLGRGHLESLFERLRFMAP